jgi:hypothetical protein
MKPPTFTSEPYVQYLSRLVEEVDQGLIQVPRFQRPMVWDWERRRELLRSIRDGVPFGAFMVWRTANVKIARYERLGYHRLRRPPEGAAYQYLLDGVQRLSTLFGALKRPAAGAPSDWTEDPDPDSDEVTEDFSIYYDLKEREFIKDDEVDTQRHRDFIPLWMVFDSVALLRFQRSLPEPTAELWIKDSDELARAFRECKVPVIPIATENVDLASKTFQRINSLGAQMTEAHMIHALAWSDSFDLLDTFRRYRREYLLEIGWEQLEDEVILRCCKAALNLDVYRAKPDEVSELLKQQPSTIIHVFQALRNAALFLRSECKVPSLDAVPYSLQIVLLADVFHSRSQQARVHSKLLVAWFWMTTYGEVFAGLSGDYVQRALVEFRKIADTGIAEWTFRKPYSVGDIDRSFDFRRARAKAFSLRLVQKVDESQGNNEGTSLFREFGRRAVFQLFGRDLLDGRHYSSAANRFLIAPAQARDFLERLFREDLTDTELEAHFLNEEVMSCIHKKDLNRFVDLRFVEISEYEEEFLQPLVSRFVHDAA